MLALMGSRAVEARAGEKVLQGKYKIFQTAAFELEQDVLHATSLIAATDQVYFLPNWYK